jgi:PAS domain S-box-containing protein
VASIGTDSARLRHAPALAGVAGVVALVTWVALPVGPLRAMLLLLVNSLVVAALLIALQRFRPVARLPWLVLLAVQLCSVTAFVFWYLIPSITGWVLPSPSFVDGLFLALYAGNCVVVGTLSMRQSDEWDRRTVLDVLMVSASLGALSWVFLIQPYIEDAELSTAVKLVSVAYPALDLVLVVLALRLAFTGGRSTPAKALLLGWAFLQLAGDTAYGVLVLRGEWSLTSPVMLLYIAAFACLAAAALHPTMADLGHPSERARPGPRWARQAVIAATVLTLPAVLTVRLVQGDPHNLGVIAGASVVVCLLALARGGATGSTRRARDSRARRDDRVALLQLVTGFVVCALFPLALLAVLSVRLSEGAVESDARARISATSTSTAALVQNEMEGVKRLVNAYAERQLLTTAFGDGSPAALDAAGVRRHLNQLEAASPRITGAFITDADGRLRDVVPATPAILGEDFSYRDWYRGALAGEGPYASEAYQTKISGHALVVGVSSTVRRPGDGEVVGVLTAVYSLETFQGFSDELADAQGVILHITDQNGVLVAAPGANGKRLVDVKGEDGVSEALKGRKGLHTTVDDGGEEMLSAYVPVADIGWTVTARVPTATAYASLGSLRGTVLTIAILLGQVLLAGLVLIARTQRQRREAERSLSEREEATRGILEAAADAFVAIDSAGRVTSWSAQSEALFGWTSDQACGSLLAELIVPPELRRAHTVGVSRVVRTGISSMLDSRAELTALHRDGREFPVELVIWRSSSEGDVSFNAFVHDISDRKRDEAQLAAARDEALEASRVKSDFMAVMSHELRTPMNGVMGMTSLLLSTQLTPKQRDYAETVRASADSLLDLLNDVLDLSKVEADRLELEVLDFDLRPVVRDVVHLLEGNARVKGVSLTAEIADDVPRALRGDPARLRQIIFNLVGNALKFTGSGSVALSVVNAGSMAASEAGDEERVALLFEVTDTGIGIAAAERDRLFEAFSQADASTTRRYGGSGLGLAICKRLVALFDGEIGVRSELGTGSTFWFTARLLRGSPAAIVPDTSPEEDARPRATRSGLVLVVDDNVTNQKIAIHMLETLGHRTDVAADGVEAVDACGNVQYDLVLMDCRMPHMDGYEATRAIRDVEGSSRRTPIVAMTASAMFADHQRCLTAGMDDYLSKPVRLVDLADKVDRWIRTDDAPSGSQDGPAGNEPILDEAIIAELASLGDDVMAELIPEFISDTEARLDTVRAAVRDGDVELLTGAAHALRGSAGNMGGARVATMCRRLEDAARSGQLDQTPNDVLVLEAEVVQLLAAMAARSEQPT